MSTSAIPGIITALVTAARTALPTTNVYDGYGVSDDPNGAALMVGVSSPYSQRFTTSARSTQQWANANHTARDQEGEINCAALAWNGDGDQAAARDAAYAVVSAVENLLRADPQLGLSTVVWTGAGSEEELQENQDEAGAEALVLFSVAFRARI